MAMRNKFVAFLAVAGVAVIGISAGATPSEAKNTDIKFRCKAKGPGHIALHARFEERNRTKGVREKFNAEFEARAGGSFTSGQHVSIIVDGTTVGTVTLTPAPSGELSGELEFDTKLQAGHTAFPSNFPEVGAVSTVEAANGNSTILGCELQ